MFFPSHQIESLSQLYIDALDTFENEFCEK